MALEITDSNFQEILAEGKPVVMDSGHLGAALVRWWDQSSMNWLLNMKER